MMLFRVHRRGGAGVLKFFRKTKKIFSPNKNVIVIECRGARALIKLQKQKKRLHKKAYAHHIQWLALLRGCAATIKIVVASIQKKRAQRNKNRLIKTLHTNSHP